MLFYYRPIIATSIRVVQKTDGFQKYCCKVGNIQQNAVSSEHLNMSFLIKYPQSLSIQMITDNSSFLVGDSLLKSLK